MLLKKDSTHLKWPLRYFPWGVGGEKLKLMLTQSTCAGAGTELGKKKMGDGNRYVRLSMEEGINTKRTVKINQTYFLEAKNSQF